MTQVIDPVQGPSLGTTSLQESLTTSPSAPTTTEKLQVSTSIELKSVPPEVKAETPKGKEIVPGFGIVMSMQLLNSAYNMQQQQVQEYISLEQENEYGRIQEFTLSLLSETNVGDRFDSLNRNRWANLLRNNPLQRLAEYD
jgi:hypothetical protein